MGSNNDFELQLRALREEVEGISLKLASSPYYSSPHHRSGPPYHAESEGLNHQTEDPGGGALPPFPGPLVNGGFGQSGASNGGCHKEGPRLFGASSSASMATTDVTGVQTWILEAGTPAGQLARAQRALQDMAAERDGAVYRHREAVRTNDLLRKRLEELGELKNLYKQLQDEYLLLQKSYRSSEQIRMQQKELINALKGSGAVYRPAVKEGAEGRSKGVGHGVPDRGAVGSPTAASAAELPINVVRPHEFFLNYSLQHQQHGAADAADDDVQGGAADRSGQGLKASSSSANPSPRPASRGKKSSGSSRRARANSGGDEGAEEVWRGGGAAEPRSLARSSGSARSSSAPVTRRAQLAGGRVAGSAAPPAPPRSAVGRPGSAAVGAKAALKKPAAGSGVHGRRAVTTGRVVGSAVPTSSRGHHSFSGSQSISGSAAPSGRALGVAPVSSRGASSSGASAGGAKSLKTRW